MSRHVRLQSVSLHTVYSPFLSTVQQDSQHSGSVDLAFHSYENMAVISQPASQISIHCAGIPYSHGGFSINTNIVGYSAAKVFESFTLYLCLFVDEYSGRWRDVT